MSYFVQVYRSSDLNGPPISGQTGTSIVVLNACLVDGYGWTGMSITGITRSSQTATATVSAANGLKLKTGMILTVAGANESEYNGTFTITVASTTTFTYTVTGTPATPATGTITCDNFLRISSITRGGVGNLTATVTALNNNLTLITGNWLTISGCTSTGAAQYNGTFQITVTGPNTFTYQMTADPTASASGSPVYTKAGLQWTRPFSAGTNAQTYKSAATLGALGEAYTPYPLQVVDNGVVTAYQCEVYGAEAMSADQTVTSAMFPTTAQRAANGLFKKTTAANSTQRDWTLWGDEKTFTLGTATGDFVASSGLDGCLSFGYFIPLKSGDQYNTFLTFNSGNATNKYTGAWSATWLAALPSTPTTNFYLPRAYYQFGTSTIGTLTLPYSSSGASQVIASVAQGSWLTFPSPVDNACYVCPIFITDVAGNLRGRMPGVYCPLHGGPSAFNNNDIITNVSGLSGITLTATTVTSLSVVGLIMIDTFGPWT